MFKAISMSLTRFLLALYQLLFGLLAQLGFGWISFFHKTLH
jgi:hypothetical protein